jgi:hypothetical protein
MQNVFLMFGIDFVLTKITTSVKAKKLILGNFRLSEKRGLNIFFDICFPKPKFNKFYLNIAPVRFSLIYLSHQCVFHLSI